jgi:putative endonuclease
VREYYVYVMAKVARTLYIGVTNDLERRVDQHKNGVTPVFTSKYKLYRLVYFDGTPDVAAAIEREKQLKGWLRKKKLDLITSFNPEWRDLSEDFAPDTDSSLRSE